MREEEKERKEEILFSFLIVFFFFEISDFGSFLEINEMVQSWDAGWLFFRERNRSIRKQSTQKKSRAFKKKKREGNNTIRMTEVQTTELIRTRKSLREKGVNGSEIGEQGRVSGCDEC